MENGQDDRETVKHNVEHRRELIAKAHKGLLSLEAEIAELNAQRQEIRKQLKADVGIGLGRFDAIRKLIALEENELDKAKDDLKEAFEALAPGQTLDWVAFARPKAKPAEQPTA